MSIQTIRYELSGARKGYSGTLGRSPELVFQDGFTEVNLPDPEVDTFTLFMERRWGAFPATGEPEDLGQTDEPAEREEPETAPELEHAVDQRLLTAIHSLDPNREEHWTATGMPAIAAVSALYGSNKLTRQDLELTAPGFRRPK